MYYAATVALTLRKGAVFGRVRFVGWRQRLTDSFLPPMEIACLVGRKRLTGKVRVRVRVKVRVWVRGLRFGLVAFLILWL